MIKFLSPPIAIALLMVFLTAGWFGGPDTPFDFDTVKAFATLRAAHPILATVAGAVTQLGSAYATLAAAVLAGIWLYARGEPKAALLLTAAVAIERMVDDGLKLLIARARPPLDLHAVPVSSASFPSGHAANSMTTFLLVALIACPQRYRRRAVTVATLLSFLIGLTRPVLGVHWPSDVIGGWALGLLAIWCALAIGRRSTVLLLESQHQIIGRHRPPLDQD